MKLLALLLTLVVYVNGTSLSIKQQEVLEYSITYGEPAGYGYTLAAIAEIESRYGEMVINLSDPSCGIYHILLKSIVTRTGMKDSGWNRSRLCDRLIRDRDFAASAALLELQYWEKYWRAKGVTHVWSHTVASYNGGFRATLDSPYLIEVQEIIKRLKRRQHLRYGA